MLSDVASTTSDSARIDLLHDQSWLDPTSRNKARADAQVSCRRASSKAAIATSQNDHCRPSGMSPLPDNFLKQLDHVGADRPVQGSTEFADPALAEPLPPASLWQRAVPALSADC